MIKLPLGKTYTVEAEMIMNKLLPAWAELFLRKNAKYKDVDQSLGARGVFPDINRKVGILKNRVWNERPNDIGEEPTLEVIYDLIGHLFLMAALMVRDRPVSRTITANEDEDEY